MAELEEKNDVSEMLAEQQRELERIRKKRGGSLDTQKWRKILNIIFMVITVIGAIIYFAMGEKHVGMGVWAIGLMFKLGEFYIRFMY